MGVEIYAAVGSHMWNIFTLIEIDMNNINVWRLAFDEKRQCLTHFYLHELHTVGALTFH